MYSEVTRIQEGGSISEVHPKNDVQGLKSEESEHHKLEASMGYESLSLKNKTNHTNKNILSEALAHGCKSMSKATGHPGEP